MNFLQPSTWAEALAMKAAHPEAVPIAGGTDVMVEINLDHNRPETVMDLTRVADLTEWANEEGLVRVGAGVTYARILACDGDGVARGGRAADPEPRQGGRQPGHGLARRRRASAPARVGRDGRAGVGVGHAAD